jgi:DNA-binding transcriptional LysR family regulator
MQPTEKAKALSNSVQEALHQVERALAARFDPSTARRDFRILGTDYVSVLLIPRLMAKIRERAPGIDLRLVDISQRDPTVDLEQGIMHFAIDTPRDVPTLRTAFLLSDDSSRSASRSALSGVIVKAAATSPRSRRSAALSSTQPAPTRFDYQTAGSWRAAHSIWRSRSISPPPMTSPTAIQGRR